MDASHIIASSDYAVIRLGDTSLYYGYEVTNEAGDWCFEAKTYGLEVTIPGADIRLRFGLHDRENCEMMLLGGIALLLERGELQWKP